MKQQSKARPMVVVTDHLEKISRALIEGEERPSFLMFLKEKAKRKGLYALYDDKDRLYYVGKASDLQLRLGQHLTDKHAEKWERMTMLFLSEKANVAELEGLVVAITKPAGNTQKPHIGNDLRPSLLQYLKKNRNELIDLSVYQSEKRKQADKILRRITPKKLKSLTHEALGKALGVSRSRISQIANDKNKGYPYLVEYIREGGHRDKVALLFDKEDKKANKK